MSKGVAERRGTGAVCTLGDNPGLRGWAVFVPCHAEAALLKEDATPAGEHGPIF
ncbi:MAG: hypothetical protein ACR2G1_03945 [Rubrobacteraceae bacterium]